MVSVDTRVEGSGNSGIIFNYFDKNNYSLLCIETKYSHNYYKLSKKVNGEFDQNNEWIEGTNYINDGMNNIKLVQKVNKIHIYINENQVAVEDINQYSAGIKVGLFVTTYDDITGVVVGRFDNFEVAGYMAETQAQISLNRISSNDSIKSVEEGSIK